MAEKNRTHWANMEEAGLYWLMRLAFSIYTFFGPTIFRCILYPVVTYYFLVNRDARAASLDYLSHVEKFSLGQLLESGWRQSYYHFLAFSESIIDKLSAWNNRISLADVVIHGRDEIQSRLEQNKGGMIIGSHLGNVEVCRALVSINENTRINIMVHTKHAKNFNRLLRDVSVVQNVSLLQVTEISPAVAISLDHKIKSGEFVFIVGDRIPVRNNGRTQEVSFLGENASFSQGPYILASLLKCPIYTLFCLKESGTYHLYFEHFSEKIHLPRKDREHALREYVQRFADRLQKYCMMAPLQWFNFYFFWSTPVEPEQKPSS